MATRIPTMYGRYYVISLVWRGRQFTIPVYRAKTALLQRPQAQKIADSMYPGSRVISYHESDATDDPVILVQEHNDGSAKNCKKGEYFCKEDHKCKQIPKGHHVMPDGMLMKGEKHDKKEEVEVYWSSKALDQLEALQEKTKNCGCGQKPCITYGKPKGKQTGDSAAASNAPNFPVDQVSEGAAWTRKAGKNSSGGLNEKGRKSYERDNPGSDLKAPSKKKGNKRRASFCARMKGMKKKLTSAKTARDPDSRINKSLRAWNC